MKEDEAKAKWCPMVRRADCGAQNASAVNRDGADDNQFKCIASDCMMWEPYEYFLEKGTCYTGQDKDKTREHVIGGDCGLKSKDLECNGAY